MKTKLNEILSTEILLPTEIAGESTMQQRKLLPQWLISGILTKVHSWKRYNNLQSYCIFIGYPRSGHSLIGSIIDAHENATIAHELDVLQFINQPLSFNKYQLFELISKNANEFAKKGRYWSNYSYHVPNSSQGRSDKLLLIGDKKGGITTKHLIHNPQLLDDLQKTIELPLKIIHVIRNPFDNIATISIRTGISIEEATKQYQESAITNQEVIDSNLHVLNVYHEDIISNPKQVINEIFTYFGLPTHQALVKNIADIIYSSPHQSRREINWNTKQKKTINDMIDKISFLERYTFNT